MDIRPTAPLESEALPSTSWKRAEIMALVHRGQHVSSPIILKNGTFYFPHGTYQLFRTAEGARIGIWAVDPDDLAIETMALTPDQAKKLDMRDASGARTPVPAGTQLPFRLKDMGNGNLSRLRVFAAKPEALVEKWFRSEILKHQDAFLAFQEEQGTLIRETENRWTSGGIVYELVPGKKAGTQDLIMPMAPGYGWRLGQDYDRYFTGLCGKFMRAASVRLRNVTREQAEKLVPRDFEKRAALFIDGRDPYSMVLNATNGEEAPWSYLVRKGLLHVLYGVRQLRSKEVLKTLAGLVLVNGSIGAGMTLLGFEANPLLLGGKIAGQATTRTGQRVSTYMNLQKALRNDASVDALMHRFTIDRNARQMWGGRLNPENIAHLRAMNHKELNTDQNFDVRIHPELPGKWAEHEYIWSVTQGVGTPFELGQYKGIRFEAPGGLSVEHIPDRQIRFARMDWSRLDESMLPNDVIRLFQDQPDKTPYLMLKYDMERQCFRAAFMDQASYKRVIGNIAKTPFSNVAALESDAVHLLPSANDGAQRGWLGKIFGENVENFMVQSVESIAEGVASLIRPKPHSPL